METLPIFGVLDSADIGAYTVSVDKIIPFWDRRAQDMLGFSPDQVVGRHCNEVLVGERSKAS